MTINPNQASTLSALGFSHHQIGEMKEALDYYHKAHFINNDDAMVELLVQRALDDIHDFNFEDVYLR